MSRTHRLPGPVVWTAIISAISVIYMAFVLPLGFAPDEAEHAYRAYQLSLGSLFPQLVSCIAHPHLLPCMFHFPGPFVPNHRVGGQISASLYRALQAATQSIPGPPGFNPKVYGIAPASSLAGATLFAHFENTAIYSPVNYLPQTVVFWLGRTLSQPPIATLFAARLAAGVAWASMVTASVALVPRWKWLFALALLVPTELAQAATLSADSMSFALAALTTAYALRLADADVTASRSQLSRLAVLCLLVGLLKVPIPLVVLAVIVIVWPVLGTGRERLARGAVVVVPGALAGAWWNIAAGRYFVPYRNTVFPAKVQAYISQSAQTSHLLSHLYDVPSLLWQTAIKGDLFNINGLVGTVGQDGRSGPLPEWFGLLWVGVFALLAIASADGPNPTARLRGLLAGTFVVYALVTALGLYLTATGVGDNHVNGIHGRYYTPLLALAIPLLAGLGGTRVRLSERWIGRVVMLGSTAAAVTLFAHTAYSFYNHQAPWQVLPRVFGALF
jgi:hypothetical protein